VEIEMKKAFVLINVESGTEEAVREELKKIEGVEEAVFSYGLFDIITKIKADSLERLKSTITQKIRPIGKVRSTLTLIRIEE
jgi:DNA-binding Lrp family transcriptional regulator